MGVKAVIKLQQDIEQGVKRISEWLKINKL